MAKKATLEGMSQGLSFASVMNETVGSPEDIIELSKLVPFQNHPFKVKHDEKMDELTESIKQNGILMPIIVRPVGEKYEIIAGHRRCLAAELAGINRVPAVIRNYDDNQAVIIMVDSNIQREEILPSEKAWAYRMKLEALKRQGKRTDLTLAQVELKSNLSFETYDINNNRQFRANDLIANEVGESKAQVKRYIKLTCLCKPLLDLVDEKRIAINPAYNLAFLSEIEQEWVVDVYDSEEITPSLSQSLELKQMSQSGILTQTAVEETLCLLKPNQKEKVSFANKELNEYFESSVPAEQKKNIIIKALDMYFETEGLVKRAPNKKEREQVR